MNKKEIDRFFRKTEPSTLRRVQKKGYFREEDEGDSEYEDAGSGVTDGDLEDSIPGAGEDNEDFSMEEKVYNKLIEFGLSEDQADEIITMILDSEDDGWKPLSDKDIEDYSIGYDDDGLVVKDNEDEEDSTLAWHSERA